LTIDFLTYKQTHEHLWVQ